MAAGKPMKLFLLALSTLLLSNYAVGAGKSMPYQRRFLGFAAPGYMDVRIETAQYRPSQSPKEHVQCRLVNGNDHSHSKHNAFHYNAIEVKYLVESRKRKLIKKYSASPSLKIEA